MAKRNWCCGRPLIDRAAVETLAVLSEKKVGNPPPEFKWACTVCETFQTDAKDA